MTENFEALARALPRILEGMGITLTLTLGGAALAARYGALSADHLEYASEESVREMAAAGTVGVMLPGAYYFLRETHAPPIELFRRYGVPLAVCLGLNLAASLVILLRPRT